MFEHYFTAIDNALQERDILTNASADEATRAIKEVTDLLNKKELINFNLYANIDHETGIDYDFDVNRLSIGLHWFGGRLLFSFEDQEKEPVLGLKRQQRIYIHKYLLEKFLKRALEVVTNTPLDESIQN